MTRHATESAWRRMMIERLRRTYPPSSSLDAVTLVASQTLSSIMFCMAETNPKRRGRLRRANITFQLVAGTTGRNVAPLCLRPRRVTPETVCVRIETRGDRKCDSATHGPMTTVATQAAEVLVPPVIEPHAKTRKARKRFYSTRLRVCVTHGANLMARVCKLLRVTSGTGRVAGSPGH